MKQDRLSGIPETLLITLYKTQPHDGIIRDRSDVEIFN
jgi:hypothetical protein